MTREEAIEHGKEQLEVFGGEHAEFIKLAIEALEQQPCEDCVSRKQALIGIRNLYPGIPFTRQNVKKWKEENKKYFECENVIRDLPLVTPTRKKGKWVKYSFPRAGEQHYQCTNCKDYINFGAYGDYYTKDFKYCPHCGAEMESEQSLNYVDQDTIMPAT